MNAPKPALSTARVDQRRQTHHRLQRPHRGKHSCLMFEESEQLWGQVDRDRQVRYSPDGHDEQANRSTKKQTRAPLVQPAVNPRWGATAEAGLTLELVITSRTATLECTSQRSSATFVFEAWQGVGRPLARGPQTAHRTERPRTGRADHRLSHKTGSVIHPGEGGLTGTPVGRRWAKRTDGD